MGKVNFLVIYMFIIVAHNSCTMISLNGKIELLIDMCNTYTHAQRHHLMGKGNFLSIDIYIIVTHNSWT